MTGGAGYLAALLRQWTLVVSVAVLGVIGGAGYAIVATPTFSSSSQVLLTLETSGATATRLQASSYIDQILPTYAATATSSSVLQPVIDELRLEDSLTELRKRVSATAIAGSALIVISADGDTPHEARDLAAAITAQFVTVTPTIISPLTPETAEPTPTPAPTPPVTVVPLAPSEKPAQINLVVVDSAALPVDSPRRRLLVSLLAGLAAGLVIGVGLALIRHSLDGRMRVAPAIAAATSAPLLARLPRSRSRNWAALDGPSEWAEPLRGLRSAVQSLDGERRVLAVIGATSSAGTSTLVAALAGSLDRAGAGVTVVDADLRDPSLFDVFDLPLSPGLADALEANDGRETPEPVPVPSTSGVRFVAAGHTANPGDLIASPRLVSALSALGSDGSITLVDATAISDAADAVSVARAADGVLVVVRSGSVTVASLADVVSELHRAGTPILGTVVTEGTLPRRPSRFRRDREAAPETETETASDADSP